MVIINNGSRLYIKDNEVLLRNIQKLIGKMLVPNIIRFSLLIFMICSINAKPQAKQHENDAKCSCVNDFELPYTMAEVCGGSDYNSFMDKVEYKLQSRCDLIDPKFCNGTYSQKFTRYDFIVVGSGSAGGVVAGRLAESGKNTVLLLEAGGPAPVGMQVPGMYFQYDQNSFVDWDYILEPQSEACLGRPDGVCHWPRGKGIGGTALLHGMMYMRGYPQDYDEGLVGNGIDGWSWNDVLPYFLRSEDNTEIGTHADEGYHGVGGPLTVERFKDHPELSEDILKAASELGYKTDIDLNGRERTGFTLAQATTQNGARLTTMKAFVYNRINPDNSKLHIKSNAYVSRVIVNNGTAFGVEYIIQGKLYSACARKEVILSAGTIGSPQILLNSGIGPKDQLEKIGIKVANHLPGVGQNIHNHASFSVYYTVKGEEGTGPLLTDEALELFVKNNTGPMTSTGLSQVTGFVHTKYADPMKDAPDLQVFFSGYLANCAKENNNNNNTSTSLFHLIERFRNQSHTIISISPTILRPKSKGYMELRDIYATSKPKIFAGLLTENYDVELLLEGIRFVQKLANTSALRDKLIPIDTPVPDCESFQFDSDAYWICAMRSMTNPENHQVGSCRMGAVNDEMAVTDNKLIVRGFKNLRVIDASIFPTVPSGNLNAPVIMVAERGAQFIKDAWNIQ